MTIDETTALELERPVEPLLRAEDVAGLLKTSKKTVYRWAELGTIPSIRFSRRCVRFDREAIEAYLESCGQEGTP